MMNFTKRTVFKMMFSSDEIIILFIIVYVVPVVGGIDFDKLPNLCPADLSLPATDPGNGYFCPDVYDDGSPNPYSECCHNDRPDELGNYHSCCKPDSESEAERNSRIEFIGMYIGIVTACIMVLIIICFYCRKDTVKCLDGCTKKTKYGKDKCLDGLCMCLCCRNRVTETERYKLNHVTPVRDKLVTDVPVAANPMFWNPDTEEFY
ncbi:uncharacterized protein [Amphiura filiformis]|uniref:uncharacterized protein n=1 Tax=Amphiura filiformis TaxID=82378 RepID=UPI003B20CFE2